MEEDRQIVSGASGGPDREEGAAAFTLDVASYRADLAEFHLTEAQEREFLETLWAILSAFVDLGFKGDICAWLRHSFDEVSQNGPSALHLGEDIPTAGASTSGKARPPHVQQ